MKKICIVTGTRADWGLLSRLAGLIAGDPDLNLQIIATNMHLSPEYGLTHKEIESNGFRIDKKIEMLLSSDTSVGTVKSAALGLIGFADAYSDLSPDIIIILGDRFEALSAAYAALLSKIPVAHIHGGEITEGAYDDAIRHSITKMSHLHFTSTEEYRRRVIQLGEDPEYVMNVGAISLDNMEHLRLLDKQELENKIPFVFGGKSILVTYHPATLDDATPEEQIANLLAVLAEYEDYRILFTLPNSDTGGHIIKRYIEEFVSSHEDRAVSITSLGYLNYLSALKYVSMVVGNSSSGIIEAPQFDKPIINIGDRQKGRIKADSIIDCGIDKESIRGAIMKGISRSENGTFNDPNPYYRPDTAVNILNRIKTINPDNLINKRFHDIYNG